MSAVNYEGSAPRVTDVVTAAGTLLEALEDELRRAWQEAIPALRLVASQPSLDGERRPENAAYGSGLRALASRVQALGGDQRLRSIALRYVFLLHLTRWGMEPSPVALPDSVVQLYARELSRVLKKLNDVGAVVDAADDRWRKDYAIVTGRLLPVGAEFAAPECGIPRRLIFRGGLGQRLRLLRTIAFEARGFRPYFELHAHIESLDGFHPDGWYDTYIRLAELLQLNPSYKGVIASSWLRDPALSHISPRLGYLRDYPEAHGARMFQIGIDVDGTSGALTRSPTRQRLFREGRYLPGIYLMVWPRKALLRWFEHETVFAD